MSVLLPALVNVVPAHPLEPDTEAMDVELPTSVPPSVNCTVLLPLGLLYLTRSRMPTTVALAGSVKDEKVKWAHEPAMTPPVQLLLGGPRGLAFGGNGVQSALFFTDQLDAY